MHGLSPTDAQRSVDWGLTSADYERWRPNYPDLFYQRLQQHGVGLPQQRILDLGTGVGFLARRFARAGAEVLGIDISPQQVAQGARASRREQLRAHFAAAQAEALPLASKSFDLATASQCWLYFDPTRALSELRRVLRGERRLITSHFCWLPRLDPIARACEAIILAHNPEWRGNDWPGEIPTVPRWLKEAPAGLGVEVEGAFWFDAQIPFTREEWRGRLRACRGVGATLEESRVRQVDSALSDFLERETPDRFTIRHRIDAHLMRIHP